MKYELFERVALAHDISEHGLRAGTIGTVVETYPATAGLEVEFFNEEGKTIAVLTLDSADVKKRSIAQRR